MRDVTFLKIIGDGNKNPIMYESPANLFCVRIKRGLLTCDVLQRKNLWFKVIRGERRKINNFS